MTMLRSIAMAFACFSAIPMPQVSWTKENMRYLMAAFPLVGAVVGGALWLWLCACGALGLGPLVRGAGLALLPLAITGGIHMDGFADVVDAQASHAEAEQKRKILKDPHVGAFAVMGVCGYLIAHVAFASELDARHGLLIACVPVVSRSLAGLAALCWPASGTSGMLATMRATARLGVAKVALGLQLVLASAGMLVASPCVGGAALAVAGLAFAWARRFSARQFGGLSGDLVGFCVQVLELALVVSVVVAGRIVA
ncbi:MAG: adenosylcobinamide-GDP ribazoletransferase [Atopobiaceae bacterium]|nr:adenosylcobinamide-GDP ribazoletransferase [Atopobiaceae bacterium]